MPEITHLNCENDVTLINTNGTMVKNQKLKLLQSFAFAPLDFTNLQNYTAVVDMGFFWRLCMPLLKIERKGTKRSTHGKIMLIRYFFTIMN